MITQFKPVDAMALNLQHRQRQSFAHIDGYELYNLNCPSFTYKENGYPKACFGIVPFWKGRATVWALIGDVNNWVSLHRSVKSKMDEYVNKLGIVRLELTTVVGFAESERWAEMLGFTRESVMHFYGPDGEDHVNWVRIWQPKH